MTALVTVLTIVVVLLAVLVAGLLRSHAAILRRLHELGAGLDVDPGASIASTAVPRTDGTVPAPDRTVPDGRRALDLVGSGPRGESQAVRVVDVDHDTVLVFLSSGCTTCSSFWSDLASPSLPTGTRLVIVTRDAAEESPSAVLALAPAGATVVMSSAAWDRLRVPGSPFVIHVHGPTGRVIGEGTAASWQQVLELFLRAGGDAALAGKANADARRERELDRVLLEAGVAPGDPSLYGQHETPRPAEPPVERDGPR